MKKTYTTTMPDKAGAFQVASEIISKLGLNITRVSYNKAVDTNMLFIEVEGGGAAIDEATKQLESVGYIKDHLDSGNVILLQFFLPDVPGSLLPVLRLINSYNFNISYMSSQSDGSGAQHFRMGLFVESDSDVSEFMQKVSLLCELKVLSYNPGAQVLDNTVFYLSFANRIAGEIGLSSDQKLDLIVNSNLIMELLRDKPVAQMETFDYIHRFAEKLFIYHGDAYKPQVTKMQLENGVTSILIEPPCGSNVCILQNAGEYIFIDGGMCCYRDETLAAVYEVLPDFEHIKKCLLLTHADVDHCGILDCFDTVYLSRKAQLNFELEHQGRKNLRERNPVHAPYVRISKILSKYAVPELGSLRAIGGSEEPLSSLYENTGTIDTAGLHFEVHEGGGGHSAGEVVYIERALHISFTGDIFVNVRECDPRQKEFNSIAPYLMTSVDTDPALAKQEREALPALLGAGEWTIFGGHGHIKRLTVEA